MAGLDNLPFSELLALANAASTESQGAAPPGYHSGFRGLCIPTTDSYLTDSYRLEPSSGDLNPGFSLGLQAWMAGNNIMERPHDAFPTSHQHSYDLNFPPEEMVNAVSQEPTAEFAPITPEKPTRSEARRLSETQGSCTNERANHEQTGQGNEVVDPRFNLDEVQPGKELQKPVIDSLHATTSVTSKETHDSHKRGSQGIKTPQPKPKRKKHRPKVVVEGKPKRTPEPVTPKPAFSKENPTGKRKYIRKEKDSNTSISPSPEATAESLEFKTLKPARKSSRRALNFICEGQLEDTNFACKPSSTSHSELLAENCYNNQSRANLTPKLADGIEMQKQSTSLIEGEARTIQLPAMTSKPKRRRNSCSNRDNNNKDRDQKTARNGQKCIQQVMLEFGSTGTCLTEERPVGESKEYPTTNSQGDSNGKKIPGNQYNSIEAYQTIFCVQFPNIQRKRRTEKNQNLTTSCTPASVTAMKNVMRQESCSQKDPQTVHSAAKPKFCISMLSTTDGESSKMERGGRGPPNNLHNFECITSLIQTHGPKRKRSRSSTRVRDLASLNKLFECNVHPRFWTSNRPQTVEAIISEMQSTLARKKRTKRNTLGSRSFSSKKLQMRQNIFLQHHHQLCARSTGTSPDELWNQLFSVDAITEQFNLLDINRENSRILYQELNALVPCRMLSREQNSLVLYRRNGTLVPFGGSFYPIRRQRPRPKVELDDETNRVWKLLMANINSEGIDGTDEEKAKWWEEERSVFQARADSFIARMRLVQGDRRFSPWKGSVVDSVVGVFLTQNVSDHLSSSAFMSLAALFPQTSNFGNEPCHEEGGSSIIHEPLVYFLESEDTMSAPTVCEQSAITLHGSDHSEEKELHASDHSEEKEVIDIDETARKYSSFASPMDKPICKLTNSPENAFEPFSDSEAKRLTTKVNMKVMEKAYFSGDRRKIHILSQDSVLLSQNYENSITTQNAEITGSSSGSNSEVEDFSNGSRFNSLDAPTSLTVLLQSSEAKMLQGHSYSIVSSPEIFSHKHIHIQTTEDDGQRQHIDDLIDLKSSLGVSRTSSDSPISHTIPSREVLESFESFVGETKSFVENSQRSSSYQQKEDDTVRTETEMFAEPRTIIEAQDQKESKTIEQHTNLANQSIEILAITESTNSLNNQVDIQSKTGSEMKEQSYPSTSKPKSRTIKKEKNAFDWDSLRREAESNGRKRERTARTMDSVDWDAVRCSDIDDIAKTIRERGMNNMLAERIKDFLNRLVREHGSIDLEWLRDVPPDKAKEYLLSIRGLGLKSVECVRLLTLYHLAFPVDTNVGRIAVRLGWVPLQPLPESLQLHLLELYPVLESIQKYLWPRLCKLDQRTLYELHYQMITFGKVFCTKRKPNCNACPMRGECRHFASAFASARLALPGPEERRIVNAKESRTANSRVVNDRHPLFLPQGIEQSRGELNIEAKVNLEAKCEVKNYEPVIEEPATPEPECTQVSENDNEDAFYEDPDEIPTIKLNMEAFTQNLQNYMQGNMELQEGDVSKALVALSAEAASISMPKLKNVSRLRTEHQVYELPDSHPLLEGLDKRESDDPCSYLLAIWTPGETSNSIQPPDKSCKAQENGELCNKETCFSCNSIKEAKSQIIRGTLLIPCRTAMRGRFPLNGTYFQVNEVFADHGSSLNPIDIPREWIWNLPRRTVFFGTSIPTIFRGLTTEGIQHCFWRGYVCVRGFDQKTRAPRPLIARLHFPASQRRGRTNADKTIADGIPDSE